MTTLLSDDEQSYFREMESLFNQPGWDRLVQEMKAEVDALPAHAFENAKTWEELLKVRARVQAIRELITYPQLVELRRTQAEQLRFSQIESIQAHEQTD